MKRLFLYVILPGIVLGVVYQSGRNSSAVSGDRPSAVQSSPEEIDKRLATVSEKLAQIESLRSGKAAPIRAGSDVSQESKPAEASAATKPVPGTEPSSIERYQFRELPLGVPALGGKSLAVSPPGAAPARKNSELGLMPLLPVDSIPNTVRPIQGVPLQKCDCGVKH
jgi:hypothetical protein